MIARLEALADPDKAAGMKRFAVGGGHTLGVSIPALRALAGELGRSHLLARELWASGIHEARILASMIEEPALVEEAQMEEWVAGFDSWDLTDQVCMNLFEKTKLSWRKAVQWAGRKEEFQRRAGFALMACLAWHDRLAAAERFEPFLEAAEAACGDGRNFVKKSISWALRNIGKRSRALNARAVETARRIQARGGPAPRWIGADVLRELTGPAVERRLAAREAKQARGRKAREAGGGIANRPHVPDVPEELRGPFLEEGIQLLGIAAASESPEAEAEYGEWLRRGLSGSMRYLQRHHVLKYRPSRILPGCRSVLLAGLNYYQEAPGEAGNGQGRVARYAMGRDYHRVLGGKLGRIARRLGEHHPREEFRPFTDASPLAERFYAERAGIGFTGRNTLLISSQYGSWFFIGEILSTAAFPPSGEANPGHLSCPAGCRRCIEVCPTGALVSPQRIDASRCISYLTIEHKGSIPEELRPRMGSWLLGCDLCQEVCPLNVRRQVTSEQDFLRLRAGAAVEFSEVLSIRDQEEFRRRYAGTPLMRAGRVSLIRNACIAAANTGAGALLPLLKELAREAEPVIAEHAAWAVRVLTGAQAD